MQTNIIVKYWSKWNNTFIVTYISKMKIEILIKVKII